MARRWKQPAAVNINKGGIALTQNGNSKSVSVEAGITDYHVLVVQMGAATTSSILNPHASAQPQMILPFSFRIVSKEGSDEQAVKVLLMKAEGIVRKAVASSPKPTPNGKARDILLALADAFPDRTIELEGMDVKAVYTPPAQFSSESFSILAMPV